MVTKGIEFEEILEPFDMESGNQRFKAFSPTGKVPCLVDEGVTIWESLAILEFLADKYPDKDFWPSHQLTRGIARSVSNEMLGGFIALRAECPMNMSRSPRLLAVSADAKNDVKRIEEIWDRSLQKSGGPFLFGDFSNADAMFAPVVNRLEIYQLSHADCVGHYTKAMKANPAWQQWEKAGRAETWIVDDDEA